MIEFQLFDNLLHFVEEFYELLKSDWKKFKLFIKENKDYVIWLCIAIITLQFVDIMSLGSSWNRYCIKNNIQIGGAGGMPSLNEIKKSASSATSGSSSKLSGASAPSSGSSSKKGAAAAAASDPSSKPTEKPKLTKQEKKDKKAKDKVDKKEKKVQDKKDKTEKKAKDKTEAEQKKKAEDEEKKKEEGDKDNGDDKDKKKSMKDKLKSSAGQHGLSGPVLGNLDGVFNAVGGMFTFAAFILLIIGIMSLPVLIFLVLTYTIIKLIAGKLALY